MHKVVTINLNGRGYQVDDDAYEALRAYLARADAALQGNPDRQEILADLEQAIADKSQRFLSPHKSIVSLAEITEVIEEMGPVDAGADHTDSATPPTTAGGSATGASPDPGAPRRFYRIPDTAMIGGICSGAAAFTGVDVTLIRAVVFAVSAIELALSHTGIFAIVYVVLMFVLPEATTSEERAAASGAPFNAREIVDRIKRLSRELDHDLYWKRNRRRERHERRELRRAWREGLRRRRAYGSMRGFGPPVYTLPYGTRVFAGLALPVLTFLSAAAFWFGMYLVLTLLRAGSVVDWEPFGLNIEFLDNAPLWVAAFVVFIVTMAVTGPLHAARRAARLALGDGAHGWYEAWDGLLGVAFGAFILWFAYTQLPEVRDLIQHLPDAWTNLRDSFRS